MLNIHYGALLWHLYTCIWGILLIPITLSCLSPTLLIAFLFPTSFLSTFHVFFTTHWVYLGLGYLREVKGHLQEHGQLLNGYIITEEYFLLSNINGL